MSEHRFKKRLLTSSVFAGAALIAVSGMTAQAQEADEAVETVAASADEEAVQDTVVVTGSRLGSANYAAISPVTSVGAEQIDLSGTLSVETLLNDLPQVIPGNTVTSNNAGGEDFATIDLRGLGASRTLVLINGERVPPSSTSGVVDINTIPAGLIEKVDVVTGGASAVYGSDAISGVVNFILKDDYEGGELSIRRGATTDGQLAGSEIITGLVGGNFDNGRGNATLFAQYSNQDGVLQGQFDYSKTSAAIVYGYDYPSFDLRGLAVVDSLDEYNAALAAFGDGDPDAFVGAIGGGSSTPPWGFISNNAGNPFGANYSLATDPATAGTFGSVDADCDPATAPTSISGGSLSFDDAGNLTPRLASGACAIPLRELGSSRYNYAPDNYIYLPGERHGITSTVTYDLTDSIEMKTFLSYQSSSTQVQLAATPITGLSISPSSPAIAGADGIVGTADDPHPDLSAALNSRPDPTDNFTMSWRSLAVGPRVGDFTNHSLIGRVGFSGDLTERYDWNLSVGYGKVDFNSTLRNNVNRVALQQGLAGCDTLDSTLQLPSCVDVDIFGFNSTTTEMSNFIRTDLQSSQSLEQSSISGFIRGEVFELPAGWINGVVGLEYRSDDAALVVDDAQRRGEIAGFNAQNSIYGAIDVYEAYTEVSVPLVSEQPFFHDLSVEAGYRVSDYNTIGSVDSYKYGLNWAPTDWIRARAIYNKAVRAPSASESFRAGDQGFPSYSDPCRAPATAGDPTLLAFCTTDGNIASGFVPAAVAASFSQNNSQVQAFAFGDPTLSPETGETITAGFVLEPDFLPVGDFRASLDYVNIKLDDAIVGRGAGTVLSSCYSGLGSTAQSALDCQQIVRDPATGQILSVNTGLQNSLDTIEITGYDLQLDYSFDLEELFAGSPGEISISNLTTVTDEYLIGDTNYAGQTLAGIGGATPDYKVYTTLGYRLDDWTFQLAHAFVPGLKQDLWWIGAEDFPGVPKTPEFSNFDVSAAWNVNDNFSLSATIQNVADELPPQTASGVFDQGNTDAALYAPWVVGRMYSIGAKVKF